MKIAITRQVSSSIDQCVLTHLERQPIDFDLARLQHQQYESVLSSCGCRVVSLSPEVDYPDSVFVEDVAIVLDELAIITNPGAASRQGETESIAQVLKPYRHLEFIREPGRLDGGDVLCIDKNVYVGVSSRTNQPAIEQLSMILSPYGYTLKAVRVEGCLHLKSAVTQVSSQAVLLNPVWVESSTFEGVKVIEVHRSEPYAANCLMVGETLIYPDVYPITQSRLEREGIRILTIDVTELIKAEGAVTCCSLVFSA